jgi:hypothetical protein
MIDQRFFVCKTCWPRERNPPGEGQIGCCVVCAYKCHAAIGHHVVEVSICTPAYCDCGEGTLSTYLPTGRCSCLRPDP